MLSLSFDLHLAIIGLENQFSVFLKVAVLDCVGLTVSCIYSSALSSDLFYY